jgi:pseudouridine synthase
VKAGSKKSSKNSSNATLRLNKFIADAGICSRRQADEHIERGVVKVNGVVVTEQGTKVHLSDLVTVKGEPVNAEKHLTYIVLNKPKDYITTTSDEKGRKTVMDLVPIHERIYPIGRLDRHTTGVLLLTNDGDLAHRLMHPSYNVSRMYTAYLDKRLSLGDAHRVAKGVEITPEDGEKYVSGECNVAIDPADSHSVLIELAEGKNREVRRIFETIGYEVERLDRKEYAGVTARGLRRGEYRHLTKIEVRTLERLVGLSHRLEEAATMPESRAAARSAVSTPDTAKRRYGKGPSGEGKPEKSSGKPFGRKPSSAKPAGRTTSAGKPFGAKASNGKPFAARASGGGKPFDATTSRPSSSRPSSSRPSSSKSFPAKSSSPRSGYSASRSKPR